MSLPFRAGAVAAVYRAQVTIARRRVASTAARLGGHGHDPHEADYQALERHPENYRPGASSYDYDNPWPMLNKGRLDWLFADGWRRPLARDQGGYMRRNWFPFGFDLNDEHEDWVRMHLWCFCAITGLLGYLSFALGFVRPDWPASRNWSQREAYFEMERREKLGLPYISADLLPRERVEVTLPSEEELGDFQILL